MKKFAKLTLLCLSLLVFDVKAQINTPQPSPAGSVSSTVGLTDISIDYSRPKVKGRAIFGAGDDFLVPYGQLWRTGANSGSVLTLSTDAKVAGTDVSAGEYLILSIPDANEWTVMLYSDPSLGGNVSAFDEDKVVVKAKVQPIKISPAVETMTFNVSDISEDNTNANIELTWENTSVKIPVEVTFEDVVMKEIAAKTVVNPVNYIQAANFYYSQDKDLEQALKWTNMYLADEANAKKFWYVHLKAKILAKMGRDKEAIATAKKSIDLAKENPSGDFGYIKRNEDLISSIK